jgi:hypothetical protein
MNSAQDVTASFALAHGRTPPPTGTTITKPKVNAKKHTASFSFTAAGATSYVCELIPPAKKHHKKPKLKFAHCAPHQASPRFGDVGGLGPSARPGLRRFEFGDLPLDRPGAAA